MKTTAACLVLFGMLGCSAWATVYTFTGAGDGITFSDPLNWDAAGVPPNTDSDDWKISGGLLTLSGGEYSNRWGTVDAYDLFTAAGAGLSLSNGAVLVITPNPTHTAWYSDFGATATGARISLSGDGTRWSHGLTSFRLDGKQQELRVENGAILTNANRFFVGWASASNTFVLRNGARLFTNKGGNSRIGYGDNAVYNRLYIGGAHPTTGGKTLWDASADGAASANGTLAIGESVATADANTALVDAYGVVTNVIINLGPNGDFNRLTITNGGVMANTQSAATYIGGGGSENTLWIGGKNAVSGERSTLTGVSTVIIGSSGKSNLLAVAADGLIVLSSSGNGFKIGYSAGGAFNRLEIQAGGEVDSLAANVLVGEHALAYSNRMDVIGGKYVGGGAAAYAGRLGTGNVIRVTSGGVFDNGGKELYVGGDYNQGTATSQPGGSFNTFLVDNGGVLTNLISSGDRNLCVGHSPNGQGNALLVTNGGKLFTSGSSLLVGAWRGAEGVVRGGNDTRVVIDGGLLSYTKDAYVGYGSSGNSLAFGGTVVVSTPSKIIYVGANSGTNNELRVSGTAVVTASSIRIGDGTVPWRNRFTAGGGTVMAPTVVFADHSVLGAALTAGTNTPTLVSGAVTFGSDILVDPAFAGVPAASVYTVLEAQSVTGGENLRLSDAAAASGRWKLSTTATSVRLTYAYSGLVVLIQ